MKRLFARLCRSRKAALPLAAAALLAGCGASDETELRGWMNSIKQAKHVTSQPVPPHEEFIPFVYDSGGAVEPFDPQKMVLRRRGHGGPLQPDLGRPPEPLEDFPLDQIQMVGTIKDRTIVALLEVNGSTFKVEVGNHVGQNFGVVTRITETELFLQETVQDAAGEWVQRPAKLELILCRGGRTFRGRLCAPGQFPLRAGWSGRNTTGIRCCPGTSAEHSIAETSVTASPLSCRDPSFTRTAAPWDGPRATGPVRSLAG
jgi:type IV pilus assembly protein PilP